MAIKLVSLDLDGTLLTTEKRLTERTRKVLSDCLKKGIQIVPTTGRTLEGIPEDVMTIPGLRYAIVINGAGVIDIVQNRMLQHHCMPWDTAAQVLEIAERFPVMYDAYIEGRGKSEARFLSGLEEYGLSPQVCALIRNTRDEVDNLKDYVVSGNRQVEKFNITFKDSSTRFAVRTELQAIKGIIVTSSTPGNLEINEANATKGNSLSFLAEYLHLENQETMAFGDGENDRSMIEAAGTGIAMSNGSPELKKAADFTTASNDEDGVAKVLEAIIEGRALY